MPGPKLIKAASLDEIIEQVGFTGTCYAGMYWQYGRADGPTEFRKRFDDWDGTGHFDIYEIGVPVCAN